MGAPLLNPTHWLVKVLKNERLDMIVGDRVSAGGYCP